MQAILVAAWGIYFVALTGIAVCEVPVRRRRWGAAAAVIGSLVPLAFFVALKSSADIGLSPRLVPIIATELVVCLIACSKADPIGLFLVRTRSSKYDAAARRRARWQAALATTSFLLLAAGTVAACVLR